MYAAGAQKAFVVINTKDEFVVSVVMQDDRDFSDLARQFSHKFQPFALEIDCPPVLDAD